MTTNRAATLLVAACLAAPVRSSITVLPVGDSITYGCGDACAYSPGDSCTLNSTLLCSSANNTCYGGYRSLLYSLLTAAGHDVALVGPQSNGPAALPLAARGNAGYPGATIGPSKSGLDLMTRFGEWAAAPFSSVDYVLLLIGTNDIWSWEAPSTILGRYGALLDRVRGAFSPATRVLVSSVLDMDTVPDVPNVTATRAAVNAGLAALVAARARAGWAALELVDVAAATGLCPESPRNNSLCCRAYNVHPSDAGYARVAAAWFAVIDARERARARAAPAAPTSYYISPTGSDSSAGTSPATAWRSAARASALRLSPGAAVLFDAGAGPHELGGGGLTLRGAGPLRVGAYNGPSGARAVLHVDAAASAGVRAEDVAGGVEISDLSLAHTGARAAVFNGVEAAATTTGGAGAPRVAGTVLIHDVDVAGFRVGVSLTAAGCGGFASARLARLDASGSLGSGIASSGADAAVCYSHADVEVADSTAHDNPGDASDSNSWSGSGIVLSAVDGALITRCSAYRNGGKNGHAGGGPVGIWFWETHNGTISHSLSFNNSNGHPGSSSNDGGGFDLDGGCQSCVVEYSLSFNNAGPGFLVCSFGGASPTVNNTVRYSVSLDDGGASGNGAAAFNTYTPDSLAGVAVYGNTFVTTRRGSPPLVSSTPYGARASRFQLSNNALLALGGDALLAGPLPQLPKPVNVTNNAWWGGSAAAFAASWAGVEYASLAALRAGAGLERDATGAPTGTDADPGATPSAWFAACVPPAPEGGPPLPAVPNSPALDAVRGFAGCA